jgi:hypothetical protein
VQTGSGNPRPIWFVLISLCAVTASAAGAAELTVQLPAGAAAESAQILEPSTQPGEDGQAIDGDIHGRLLTFTDLSAKVPYSLLIGLKNGPLLHGVNMAWYDRQPPQPDAGPLTTDDLNQIKALVSDVKSFYNDSRIITLSGDHQRATVLVQRIRSASFHGDRGGEVIWRVELWYFINEFGGWSEVPQTNQVLRRARFASQRDYHAAVDRLRWVPLLGNIVLPDDNARRQITLPAAAIAAAATRP